MKASRSTVQSSRTQGKQQRCFSLPALFMLLAIPCAAQTCNYTVTSLADSGPGTLRDGLADPEVTDICFKTAGTIKPTSTLQILYPVTITGKVTIDGSDKIQILQVRLSSGAVRINGMVLSHGNANYGGALEILTGNVTLVGTTITGNTAILGAGVFNQSTLTLSQCNISSNTAISVPTSESFGIGGGIYNDANGVLTLQDSTLSQNSSTDGAGGQYQAGVAGGLYNAGNAQVNGDIFTGNTGYQGGAIYNDGSNFQITGGSFSNNTALAGGGAIYNQGTAQVTQALFTGNTVQSNLDLTPEGGALYNSGSATVTESTFTANSSSQNGGAIGNVGEASLTLVNDTIYGNSAKTGSGIDNQYYSNITLHNTIVAGTAPSCPGCANVTADNLIDVEPYLGPLASNGGPTYTMMPLPGGPAVGGGDPNAIVDDTDQRGFSRLSASGSVDVGAVQTHYSAITYLTQPSNGFINQIIAPPVAVRVLEVDGSTNNYPLGVPVVVSLLSSEGVPAPSLSGTLTQLPVTTNGGTAASFGDLAIDTAGSYKLQATIVPSAIGSSASVDPAYGVISNIFQINSAPVISWQPGPIAYGPMPAGVLNGTATINGAPATGTFVYTFAGTSTPITVGQIYPAGSYHVQVTFTPTGTTLQYPLMTTLQINPATPVILWPTPAAIYTSTPLGSTQLNATATGVTGAALPGTFVYNPAAGTSLTAGAHTLGTTFTPTDAANYATATAQVTIQVNAVTAAKVVLQKSADPITFGQSETFTAVVTGTDGNPFSGGTANFTVDGTAIGSAAVNNGSAAVSTKSVSGGAHQVGVTYTNTATEQTLTATGSLTVNKATPVVMWPTPAAIFASTPLGSTQLNATAAGVTGAALPGTFVYNPAAGTLLSAGSQTLSTTFTPTDTTDYATATAQVTIQVNAVTGAKLVLQKSADSITFGQSETFTVVVTGTDGNPFSGGTASFTVDGTAIGSAAVNNGSAAVSTKSVSGGTHQVGVTYTNTATKQTLTASGSLTVNKATPVLTWPTPTPIFTVTPLGTTQLNATATGVAGAALPGTFVYNPAAGTLLSAGSQMLGTTFTPTDTTDYTTATAQVSIQVNAVTGAKVALQKSADPITFGQTETFTAVVTGTDGNPLSGGTASFTVDGAAIGSAAVNNGSAAVSTSSLSGGTHQVGITYTNTATKQTLTASGSLTVNKATPVLTWPTPTPIYTVTPLGSTQLDATAKGINGAALPGTFVYNPAAGTMLPAGSQTLSTTFTPTDTTDYATATAQVTIQVGYLTIAITSVSPGTAALGTTPLALTITGSGFTATSVAEVNGTAIATTVQSSTALTATLPASYLAKTGTLQLMVYDSRSKFSSNAVQFTVTAPPANVTLSIPPSPGSGDQPIITIGLNSPYPSDLQGTLALAFAPSGSNGVDDPAIKLTTGGRTLTFTVPAGSTTTPQVAFQTGTVAGTITLTLTLTAGGADVTPAGLTPITLVIAPAAPTIKLVTLTKDSEGKIITVAITGFSNTREMTQAEFVFTGTDASHLRSSKVDVEVTTSFTPWYSNPDSDAFGSQFTYTQNFKLSRPDAGVTGVSVTLANSVGTSGSVNSQ
jgi:23S rRNA A1618 N6-methylase RlmF